MADTTTEAAAGTGGERRILKPTLHHYGVNTPNIKAVTEWYETVVGFYVANSADSPIPSAYVTNDGAHHRSGFFTPPDLVVDVPNTRVGVNHVAFEYETVDDLLESWTRLKDLGIEPQVMTCHGTHWAFYYRDPDFNMVELLADTYGDWEKSLAFVKTPEYAADPMGPAVDPAMMIEARKAGVSLDELRERTMRGEYTPDKHDGPEVLI